MLDPPPYPDYVIYRRPLSESNYFNYINQLNRELIPARNLQHNANVKSVPKQQHKIRTVLHSLETCLFVLQIFLFNFFVKSIFQANKGGAKNFSRIALDKMTMHNGNLGGHKNEHFSNIFIIWKKYISVKAQWIFIL